MAMATSTFAGPEGPDNAERGPAPDDAVALVNDSGEDLLIERPDIGTGCATLVVAGDRIPPHIARESARSRATGKPVRLGRSE